MNLARRISARGCHRLTGAAGLESMDLVAGRRMCRFPSMPTRTPTGTGGCVSTARSPGCRWTSTPAAGSRRATSSSSTPTTSARTGDRGIVLAPLRRTESADGLAYDHVTAVLDRAGGVVTVTVHGPAEPAPANAAGVHAQAGGWMLAVTRQLDDLILRLRTNEPRLGTWVLRSAGDLDAVLAHERVVADNAATDWLCNEIQLYVKRTLKRLDVTSRSLIALIEPGSCFAGWLLDAALAGDRQYMLDGPPPDDETSEERAEIALSGWNFGALPMGNGLSRL